MRHKHFILGAHLLIRFQHVLMFTKYLQKFLEILSTSFNEELSLVAPEIPGLLKNWKHLS
jgi:hypothetical protein